MPDHLKPILTPVMNRQLMLDLIDRLGAEAVKAFKMVQDHSGLDQKRSRELVGQARFRMMEKGFEEVCEFHGGHLLVGGVIPQSTLKIFQPFMRFEIGGQGVILGLASIPEPNTIPPKNKSRLAGVTLNYHLQPHLDLDGTGPKAGDVFVLFLAARDRKNAGKIEEFAIGIVDSKYEAFLHYESVEKFLSGFSDVVQFKPETPKNSSSSQSPSVSLKKNVIPFVPPEIPDTGEDEDKSSS